ncbi:MAG: C1 family peptidase [Rikenellaceae bacterium]|nr:C1 family peptidase [Rikenellaceae bacterium]
MKKLIIATLALTLALPAVAQKRAKKEQPKEEQGYVFTDVKINPITDVRNQARSGTCWCFSTMAVLESDALKHGKAEQNIDLSEMWVVRHAYLEKILKYVRMHGKAELGQGGNAHDVPNMIEKYGIVPESVYPGLNYGTDSHVHGEVDGVLKAYADVIVSNPNRTLTTAWIEGVEGILDAYFGKRPETFEIDGKTYTPRSYAEELGFTNSDYIDVTSFSHHPFGEMFALEIPDNWAWGLSYNVPVDDMMAMLDEALENGYTVCWGSDVSEKGFAYTKGFAVLPETDIKAMDNNEQQRWVALTPAERDAQMYKFDKPVPEKKVTQQMRQEMFDNYTTTDDHGMQIFGIAKDQNGNKFYKVKNSWGTSQLYGGCFYVSAPFVAAKTTNLSFNKNALSQATRDKFGIK